MSQYNWKQFSLMLVIYASILAALYYFKCKLDNLDIGMGLLAVAYITSARFFKQKK